jgi:hypothetical protein
MPMEESIALTQLIHTLTVAKVIIEPNLMLAWLHFSIAQITLNKVFIRYSLAPNLLAQITTKLNR